MVTCFFFTSRRGTEYNFPVVFFTPLLESGRLSLDGTRAHFSIVLVFTVVGGGGSGGEGMCFLKARVIGRGLLT